MQRANNLCQHIAVCADDLCVLMKEPLKFLEQLQQEPHNFKPKGSGPLEFHLGCGFCRDEDGLLVMDQAEYIEKMIMEWVQS